MRSAVKIPLLVDEREAAVLDGQSRIANWLYNKLLEIAHDLRTQYRASQDQAVGRTLYTERGTTPLPSHQSPSRWQTWEASKSRELAALSCLEALLVFVAV
jgi:hypothetical protein